MKRTLASYTERAVDPRVEAFARRLFGAYVREVNRATGSDPSHTWESIWPYQREGWIKAAELAMRETGRST